jgi:hypothetical protein
VNNITVSCSVPVVVTTLASSQDHPSGIMTDGTKVYYLNEPPLVQSTFFSVPVSGATPPQLRKPRGRSR